jgi:ABC-2 type transport system permease protein
MNAPPVIGGPPSTDRALQRLFLMLFLRGHSSRGLQKQTAPKSLSAKLGLTISIYVLIGLVALAFLRKPVFALSAYLHAMTFMFLGMFIAASAGEILFNKEEGDILLHRPVTARQLLWAKIRVLTQVSLWLAAAFNLCGFFVGIGASDGGWLFPFAHVISTATESLFCVSAVVVVYQLCLRWAGRERLEAIMTTTQVIIAIASVLAGQALPRLMMFADKINFNWNSWWVAIIPPVWFAGIDDAVAGSGAMGSWLLAAVALLATAGTAWLAFSRLAADYAVGLQGMNEAAPTRKRAGGRRRLLDIMVEAPPLRWWLRDPVARASFLLTAAYLWRDRDVKLRVYPGLAPMMVMPVIILLPHGRSDGDIFSTFGIPFASVYLGMTAMLGLGLLRYSQQWQAADIFRCAALPGPAQLCHGARRAVLVFLAAPVVLVFAVIVFFIAPSPSFLLMALPGLITLPVFPMVAEAFDPVVPLSQPPESANAANRFVFMMTALLASGVVTGLAYWSWKTGWFGWFLLGETIVCSVIYFLLRQSLNRARWTFVD